MIDKPVKHQPVLLTKVLEFLKVKPGENYLDCTLGSAGHSLEIAKLGGHLYGLDIDPKALKRAKTKLKSHAPKGSFHLTKANFNQIKAVADKFGITTLAGILMDLGLSSEQLADINRGFSFNLDSPLDMRANPDYQVTAADLVNGLNKGELYELFQKLGQEQHSLSIAKAIISSRLTSPIITTKQLAQVVLSVKKRRSKIHPATQVFQALRIAVNDELNNLRSVLPQAVELLKPSGRLVVISFHSLEDKIVKNFIKSHSQLKNLTPKPITPSQEEMTKNPRSRSAKLRCAQKI